MDTIDSSHDARLLLVECILCVIYSSETQPLNHRVPSSVPFLHHPSKRTALPCAPRTFMVINQHTLTWSLYISKVAKPTSAGGSFEVLRGGRLSWGLPRDRLGRPSLVSLRIQVWERNTRVACRPGLVSPTLLASFPLKQRRRLVHRTSSGSKHPEAAPLIRYW